jgi:ATP adenylyltransferase
VETLFSPWRYEYIKSGESKNAAGICIFCEITKTPERDESNFVLHRASRNFIVLNIYPYISGHLLVIPFEHVSNLDRADKQTTDELMDLTKRCQTALREVYSPGGFNLGMNLGRPAGAGIADHLHLHIMPRWAGDTNFMTSIADTRVIPEELATTYAKLKAQF